MGYYQQTLIIPKPTQRFTDSRNGYRRSGEVQRREYRNTNGGINSILAYFD